MAVHPTIQAATLGMWDTMVVMIMALVVFGPRRLPKIGRQLGKLMYEFRKASNDFRYQMEEELRNAEEADRRRQEEAERQRALAAAPATQQIEASNEAAATETAEHGSDPYSYSEPEGPDSYDAAVFGEHPPEEEYEQSPEAETESDELHVQPPETGAPVPAEAPGSRAAVQPDAAEASEEQGVAEEAPSDDEQTASRSVAESAENPPPEQPRAKQAGAETEPAAHHG